MVRCVGRFLLSCCCSRVLCGYMVASGSICYLLLRDCAGGPTETTSGYDLELVYLYESCICMRAALCERGLVVAHRTSHMRPQAHPAKM